jgi:hypothetical protein
LRVTPLLRVYPGWWRERYADEVEAILEATPRRPGDRADLLRGALDAWVHPPVPSRLPGLAAVAGGGLWTVLAAGVIAQPVPSDWPGYIVDVLALAVVSVALLACALVGVAIRGWDAAGRAIALLVWLALAGYGAWMLTLALSSFSVTDGPTLAAAQAVAMIATAAIGATLIRVGDDGIGGLVLLAGVTMLVPSTWAWLAFGAAWTAIGIALLAERAGRIGRERMA